MHYRDVVLDLRAVVYKEEDLFVAHCLEMDIVGSGNSPEKAIDQMQELLEAQFDLSIKNNLEIIHPAPEGYWSSFMGATPFTEISKRDQLYQYDITIRLER